MLSSTQATLLISWIHQQIVLRLRCLEIVVSAEAWMALGGYPNEIISDWAKLVWRWDWHNEPISVFDGRFNHVPFFINGFGYLETRKNGGNGNPSSIHSKMSTRANANKLKLKGIPRHFWSYRRPNPKAPTIAGSGGSSFPSSFKKRSGLNLNGSG